MSLVASDWLCPHMNSGFVHVDGVGVCVCIVDEKGDVAHVGDVELSMLLMND